MSSLELPDDVPVAALREALGSIGLSLVSDDRGRLRCVRAKGAATIVAASMGGHMHSSVSCHQCAKIAAVYSGGLLWCSDCYLHHAKLVAAKP